MRSIALVIILLFATSALAATPFPTTVTQADLIAKYQAAGAGGEKVRILVMPGHEPNYGGAEYRNIAERDIAVEIANKLAAELRQDPRFEVIVARDTTAWNPEIFAYFESEWDDIQEFVEDKKKEMQRQVRRGNVEDRNFEVAHNTAATDVALRLYGITKWSNEQGVDLAVHVHLNDNLGHGLTSPGVHSGFAVYFPDEQYGNSAAAKPLAEAIAYELNAFNATSTLPIENYGIVPDQDLIALGSYNTAEFPSVLVEYGYIYESKITYPEARSAVTADYARQTYRGIRDFFGAPSTLTNTAALPHAWQVAELTEGTSSPQTYALQVALNKAGLYPPPGQLLIGCPISGYVGACTIPALKAFQASKGFEQTGSIGPRTKAALQAAGF